MNTNSYITFGGRSDTFDGLGPSSPAGLPTLHVGSGDGSWRRVRVDTHRDSVTVYYEGYSVYQQQPETDIQWAVTWYAANNTMELCIGSKHHAVHDESRIAGISDGRGNWLAMFTLQLNSLYSFDLRWALFAEAQPLRCAPVLMAAELS